MKIKTIRIKNFIGVDEFNYNPKNINIFTGKKGVGKSSILEAIEVAISHNKRRTEVVRHGEEEASLFIEMDNGLEINRKVRNDSSDYLKLKQTNGAVKNTEKELRKFLNGDIFRPLDFINAGVKEQTKMILNMIEMDYTKEQINEWFGQDVLLNISVNQHVLKILKAIEDKYYAERHEVNAQIKILQAQVEGYKNNLPKNYDGEMYRSLKLQEYYGKITESQKINESIERARIYVDEFTSKLEQMEINKNNKLDAINNKYEIIFNNLTQNKLANNNDYKALQELNNNLDDNKQVEMDKAFIVLEQKIIEIKKQHQIAINDIEIEFKAQLVTNNEQIGTLNVKTAQIEEQLQGIKEKQTLENQSVEEATKVIMDEANNKLKEAQEFVKSHKMLDIEKLQNDAQELEHMKEFMHDWDKIKDIEENSLQQKLDISDMYTELIAISRDKPGELLAIHKLPLENISVDSQGLIRINGTLLDGLSDGEKLETAIKITVLRVGTLRVINLDGFEKLDEESQDLVIKFCEDNDIQAFVTITENTANDKMVVSGR